MAALERKVDSSIEHQTYTDELLRLKFSTLEAGQTTATAKFDAFVARFDTLMADALKSAGDLEASAVGKQVNNRLMRVEDKTDDHQAELDRMRGALWLARGLAAFATALGGVATLVSLFHVNLP